MTRCHPAHQVGTVLKANTKYCQGCRERTLSLRVQIGVIFLVSNIFVNIYYVMELSHVFSL